MFQESFDLMDTWYEEIKTEYKVVYPKMKTPEEKKQFIEKFKKVVIQFNKEIDLINQNVPLLQTEYEKEDLSNQIRVYENQADELENFLNIELYKDENFDYKLFDQNKNRQAAITKMNFKKNKKTGKETLVVDQHNQDFRQVALDEGNALYQEAQDRLHIIRKKISDSSEKLQSINEEILAQNYKLMEIDDLIRESQNQMVRVKDMINFFTKTFLKDKCIGLMTTLMCVLCIAIILLIFLESTKGSDDGSTTEEITAETTSGLKF